MPALTKLRSVELQGLVKQLAYAPPERIWHQVERAEELVEHLDVDASYPVDWLVYKLTGYRSDETTTRSVPGAELLADLSAFVEHLSRAGKLRASDEPVELVSDLAVRWSINRKTIERWRRVGLVGRRLVNDDGREVLGFSQRVLRAFERAHRERIAKARLFSRASESEREHMVRQAGEEPESASRSAVAKRVAKKSGRSVGAVKRAMADAAGEENHATRAGVRREGRAAWRLWRRGFETSEIAERLKRPRTVVLRAINLERLGACSVCLRLASVTSAEVAWFDQRAPVVCDDVREFVRLARDRIVVPPKEEARELRLYWSLVAKAQAACRAIDRLQPSTEMLDVAETALRSAARVKASVFRALLSPLLDTVESVLGGPIETLRPGPAAELVGAVNVVVLAEMDLHVPGRVGRLAAPVSLAAHRVATAWVKANVAGVSRAATRAAGLWAGGAAIVPYVAHVCAWQADIDVPERAWRGWVKVAERERRLLASRFGLEGEKPCSVSEWAEREGVTRIQAARADRKAWRALVLASRGRA